MEFRGVVYLFFIFQHSTLRYYAFPDTHFRSAAVVFGELYHKEAILASELQDFAQYQSLLKKQCVNLYLRANNLKKPIFK